MHSFEVLMTLAVIMAAISNCRISAETTAPPERVRLMDGSRSSEGRVELFFEGQWHTVCNDLWSLREANLVCRQLGYIGADRIFFNGAQFGKGEGDIFPYTLQCEETGEDLFQCPAVAASRECDHSEDVGVECTTTNSLRLAEGSSYGRGRLEMFDDESDQWGTVCAQGWDVEDTLVACRQLGHERRLQRDDEYLEWFDADPVVSRPVVNGGFQCTGDEKRLDNCTQAAAWTPDNCSPVGLQCNPDIYLDPDGLVIVIYGGDAGLICADNWDADLASVACRNLKHKGVLEIKTVDSEIAIILSNPVCSGDETFYTECESAEWANQGNCETRKFAAVICERDEPEIEIQSESPYSEIGTVGISFTDPDEFMPVCSPAWDIEKANVVCRQLGYSDGAAEAFVVTRGYRSDPVITALECPDGSSSLVDCTFETMDVDVAQNCDVVAGVACLGPAEDSLVPLVSSGSTSEGILEYKISGLPTLICDPDWSNTEATVACRTHGYERGSVSTSVRLGQSRDSFPVGFRSYDFTCSGSEATLAECDIEPIEDAGGCDPDDVVQVACEPNRDWDLRLVGSSASEQGRVEVFLEGEWAAIIYDGIALSYLRDRLCQRLGYKKDVSGGENLFGAGTEKVLSCSYPFPTGCEDALRDVAEDEDRRVVSVVCLPYETVENHPIRLVSETGVVNNETGRVEILHDGEWGSVCVTGIDLFRSTDRTVCLEHGYTTLAELLNAKHLTGEVRERFLSGDEKIWLADADCNYDDTRIYACDHWPWGYHPDGCTPAVVTCVPDDDVTTVTDDPGHAPNLLHARQTGLIAGGVLMVLLLIAA